eukprot:symbB.v1.2.004155.t1/scaffold235.1/size321457/14
MDLVARILMGMSCLHPIGGNFVAPGGTWNVWSSKRINPEISARQHLEWQELTLGEGQETESLTGLTGGLLRLGPFKELPTHFHPESFGEIYHFTRGNGHVKLNEYTPNLVKHEISVGLHVNIPAKMLHGIEAGDEGCEFLWMFPGKRWKDIPYLYVDPNLPHRNVASDFVLPLPLGVVDWKTLQANVIKVQNERSPEHEL